MTYFMAGAQPALWGLSYSYTKGDRAVKSVSLLNKLKAKAESMAGLMSQTGGSLLMNYDFDTLGKRVENARRDRDIAFVTVRDQDGKAIAGTTAVTDGRELQTIRQDILYE